MALDSSLRDNGLDDRWRIGEGKPTPDVERRYCSKSTSLYLHPLHDGKRKLSIWHHYLAAVCVVLTFGCDQDTSNGNGPRPLPESQSTTDPGRGFQGKEPAKVVCTTGQIADAVQRIGGAHITVHGLIGPGVDPHLYQATLADMKALKDADLVFYNGMHLEGRMADALLKFGRQTPTFAVTERLQDQSDARLRDPVEFEGHYDPHVWHNVDLWSDCLEFVADQLAAFDPTHAVDYRENVAAYQQDLATLHQEITTQVASIPADRRALVTAHDAFGYFGDAYGIDVFGLKGISTDDEVSIHRTEEIVQMLVERKIPAVFVESAVAPRVVEALIEPCRQSGHPLLIGGELYADALGAAGSGADDYVGMMRANVKTIVTALGGQPTASKASGTASARANTTGKGTTGKGTPSDNTSDPASN